MEGMNEITFLYIYSNKIPCTCQFLNLLRNDMTKATIFADCVQKEKTVHLIYKYYFLG